MDETTRRVFGGVLIALGIAALGAGGTALLGRQRIRAGIGLCLGGILLGVIGFVILTASHLVPVPDIAMRGLHEAREMCEGDDLKFSAIPKHNGVVPNGLVIPDSQEPAAGIKVPLGTTVTAAVSQGPAIAEVTGWTLTPPTPGTANVWERLGEYPDASGRVEQDGSSFRVTLTGLPAGVAFLLTITGIPGQSGNEELAGAGRTTPAGEGFWDLHPPLRTGQAGSLTAQRPLALPPGRYVAKLILKEYGGNFSMVLQNEFVRFSIPDLAEVSLSLFEPREGGNVQCASDAAGIYHFSVTGTSGGIAGDQGVELLLWVRPVSPPSETAGWSLQQLPNGLQVMHEDGTWEGKCQIGNALWPPHQGDTFDLAATVVQREAADQLAARVGVVVEPALPPALASVEARGITVRF